MQGSIGWALTHLSFKSSKLGGPTLCVQEQLQVVDGRDATMAAGLDAPEVEAQSILRTTDQLNIFQWLASQPCRNT